MNNYLVFHGLTEIFSISVAASIFAIAWTTRIHHSSESGFFLLIGIASLFVGGLDLVHTLAFKGMNVFPGYDSNLPTQLWIAARSIQSLSLLAAVWHLGRSFQMKKRAPYFLIAGYGVITALLLFTIFARVFPACYIEGSGLTPFKRICEYVICLVLTGSGVLLWQRRRQLNKELLRYLLAAIVVSILSELTFTLYVDVYGLFNMLGHLLKVIVFIALFQAIVLVGIKKPHLLLSQDFLEREQRYKAILKTAMDGFWLVDTHGHLLEVNETYCRMSGFGEAELLSMRIEDLVSSETAEEVAAHIQRIIELGEDRFESWHQRKDGSTFLAENRVQYRPENSGYFVVFLRDINDRKQAEQELILSREEAIRASKAKSEFRSSMSHELRTPMNAILGFGQLLELDKSLTPSQLDYLQEITRAGRHLLALINDVLDLSRIETGKIDLSMEKVACGELIETCMKLMESLAAKRGILMENHSIPDAVVLADRVRLKQVLVNLLSNAIKYNHENGSVRIETSVTAGNIRIAVIDSGLGISTKRMKELFTPFSRLGAENGEIEGTGIGLSISKKLIELMEGTINARSELGTGSSFWIELPRVEPDAVINASMKFTEDKSNACVDETQYTVLYIEDNPANLRLVTQILGLRKSICLLTAPAPLLGLELAEVHLPDLILLDLNMPEMDGYKVLRVLHASDWGRDIPVIAVTAHAMQQDMERGLEAGFADYLTKPLDIPKFLAAVDGQLGRKDASNEK